MDIQNEIGRVKARLKADYKNAITPKNKFLKNRDVITFIALMFTAIVTPVEVAFCESKSLLEPLSIINFFVNVFFIVDMVLQFFIAFFENGRLIKSRVMISKHYLKTWLSLIFHPNTTDL